VKFEEHCQRSEDMLGDRFEQVHIWLDHYAWVPSTPSSDPSYDPTHRRRRHHLNGIMHVWHKWGKTAALAATRHVLDDLYGPDYHDVYDIPLDEQDFVLKGFD
jgi:hypothetical protein